MFDPIRTASTLKVLTNWIAAQHIQNMINGVDSNTVQEVDPWIVNCLVGCSSADLVDNQMVRLIDLMRMMIAVSGNDAALTIGDLLTGGNWPWPDPDNCGNKGAQYAEFADTMNARAANFGMIHSYFTNPAGVDTKGALGRPYSTAEDMSILMRETMKDPLARQIVGTEKNKIDGKDYDLEFLTTVRGLVNGGTVTGVKGGKTEDAARTGLAAGRVNTEDESIATIFGVNLDFPDSKSWLRLKVAELLALALDSGTCPGSGLTVNPLPPPGAAVDKSGLPSAMDSTRAAVASLDPVGEDVLVELYRENFPTPSASVNVCIKRESENIIAAAGTLTLTVAPFDSLVGIVIANPMDVSSNLLITHNQPLGTSFALTLPPGADSLIAGPSAFAAPSFTISLENLSTTRPDTINVSERGYKYDVTMASTPAPQFSTTLSGTGNPLYKNIVVRTAGRDAEIGNTLRLIVREPGVVVVAVGDHPGDVPASGPARPIRARAYPNPFNPGTTIEYELLSPGDVGIHIYDVAGRLVRHLLERPLSAAGTYRVAWDGRDQNGVRASSGVYFARISTADNAKTLRVVLLK